MAIMKTLFNNKGISLIVLIIAMTLIAILGASFVSLMGSKQKGFLYQIDSYRALNIANAGVEYAIRQPFDGDLFTNYSSYVYPTFSSPVYPFGANNGSFFISYNFSYTDTSDILYVRSSFGSATKEVRLQRFRRYVSAISFVPDTAATNIVNRVPYWQNIPSPLPLPPPFNPAVYVPFFANDLSDITINGIDLRTNGGMTLRKIYFGSTSNEVYSGSVTITPGNVSNIPISTGNRTISASSLTNPNQCILEFQYGDTLSGITYDITFYYSLGTSNLTTTLHFSIP
jgi:hypothetical protein